jgi:hypothetical protein
VARAPVHAGRLDVDLPAGSAVIVTLDEGESQ